MKRAALSGKNKAIHPLSCWDIVLNGLSTMYYRWDLIIIERAKQQYKWKTDFHSILKKPYCSFLVIDSSFRICCRSKKSAGFLKALSQLSPFAQRTTFQRLHYLVTNRPLNMPLSVQSKSIKVDFDIKIFPIESYKGCSHFLVLIATSQ